MNDTYAQDMLDYAVVQAVNSYAAAYIVEKTAERLMEELCDKATHGSIGYIDYSGNNFDELEEQYYAAIDAHQAAETAATVAFGHLMDSRIAANDNAASHLLPPTKPMRLGG
jgi:hypothetical protein